MRCCIRVAWRALFGQGSVAYVLASARALTECLPGRPVRVFACVRVCLGPCARACVHAPW